MTATPDKLTVSSWLAELRMECYKKHLEDYETIKVRYFIAFTDLSSKELVGAMSKVMES